MTVMKRIRIPAAVRKSAEPMKSAATRRRSGVGGVIPKVMMKASARDSRNFMGGSSYCRLALATAVIAGLWRDLRQRFERYEGNAADG